MDGKTDRGKTVYPLRWSGGIIRLISYAVCQKDIKNKSIHTLKMKKVKQEQIKWIVKTSG
jgi:hypothetical protein